MKKFTTSVYYVTCPEDDTVLLGMDIKIDGDHIEWFDTIKSRRMTIEEVIDEDESHFVFRRELSEGGGVYTFVPLTLKIYNEIVRHKIIGPKDFSDIESLYQAFLQTKENAW